MKTLVKNICIGVFAVGMVSILGLIIFGLVSLWIEGMWYVPVAMIIFVAAVIGIFSLD